MKVEMLIVAVAIILIGFSIVKNILPKEAAFANELTTPETEENVETEIVNEVDNQNIIENVVDVSVFEQ